MTDTHTEVRSGADIEAPRVGDGAPVVLRADHVSREFTTKAGKIMAVDDVSLDVRRGETVGLVGESGSGKSTMARIFLDLLPATSGTVEFNGRPITSLQRAERRVLRRQMQAVFQNATGSLLPHYSVLDNITEPLVIHKVGDSASRRRRAEELLDLVGVDPRLADHYPRQFSGGQQQRISIARALALEPEVLVCDEPTSALDVSIQAQILALFQRLRDELDLTCLFISHNLGVIEKVSDRVAVMRRGRIVESAPTHALFADPQHPYTRQLLNAVLPVRRQARQFEVEQIPDDAGSQLAEHGADHWVRRVV